MESKVTFGKKIVHAMGTIMMITWLLILGPIGALLLGGVAYSMLVKNLVAGLFCSVLFFLPLFLTVTWGVVRWLQVLCENRVQMAAFPLITEPIESSPR